MNQSARLSFASFIPIIAICFVVFLFVLLFQGRLAAWKVDAAVIGGGNLLLFLVTLVCWRFHKKALDAGNTPAFLRNLYSGMLLRMFICILAFFFYVLAVNEINKPAIFIVMFLYLVYTFTEIAILLKHSKRSKNV